MKEHLDSLSAYTNLANRIVCRYFSANPFLMLKFLHDYDIIGEITHQIILSDLEFDPSRCKSAKTARLRKFKHRQEKAIFVIKQFQKKFHEERHHEQLLNVNYRKDSPESVLAELILKEEKELQQQQVNFLINHCGLTKRQQKFIRGRYVDGKDLHEMGTSKQNADQIIKTGINLLKMSVNNSVDNRRGI